MSARAYDGRWRVHLRVKRAAMDRWGGNFGHVKGEGKERFLLKIEFRGPHVKFAPEEMRCMLFIKEMGDER